MDKAFDFGLLVQKLKARGLNIIEEEAKMLVEETIGWVQESVELSETPFDNIVLIVLPEIKKLALGAVDKIDGEVG